jgi:hypothetical protein
MVYMHVAVPHHQQGPALSSFAALRISLPLATDPSLRGGVTGGDGSTCQVRFFKLNLALGQKLSPKRNHLVRFEFHLRELRASDSGQLPKIRQKVVM